MELQDSLEDFDKENLDETFYYYLGLMSDFGFVSLFSAAFPLTPIIIYINNLISKFLYFLTTLFIFKFFIFLALQVERIKLMQFSKRPKPKSSQTIGQWHNILEIVSIASIFTNAALITFNSNHFSDLDYFKKFVLFMCLIFLFISVKLVVQDMATNISVRLIELQDRQKYVYAKLAKEKELEKEVTNKKTKKTFLNIYFG